MTTFNEAYHGQAEGRPNPAVVNPIVGQGFAQARQSDPGTSHEAAASFDPTDLEQVVLGAVLMHPEGAIQDDVLAVLEPKGYKYGTITPRFRSLLNKGMLVPTGEKRKAKSGRSQRVLKAVAVRTSQ